VSGPLHGIPIGFKDIIDTEDLPTRYGSPIYEGYVPEADAACVAHTRAAGAVILGKTVTTEFAGRHPGPTAHPLNPLHTPGGSSSGSAAAVADFQVPLAMGTQTAGSMIRPSAYCGVYALKPTFGLLSCAGVHDLAETFDTLGIMARSLDDLALFRAVLMAFNPVPFEASEASPRIGFCRTPMWSEADQATHEHLEAAAIRLNKAGARVRDLDLPSDFNDLLPVCWRIVTFEMARSLGYEKHARPDGLSNTTQKMIADGEALSLGTYLDDMRRVERLRVLIHEVMDDVDVILTPAAVGEPHVGHSDTGPVTFNFLWHIMNMPAMNIPAFTGPTGLPIGAQLVARRYEDETLLRNAGWIDKHIRA
jgi:amidase